LITVAAAKYFPFPVGSGIDLDFDSGLSVIWVGNVSGHAAWDRRPKASGND
jgi:hypothetical protein